LSAPWQRVTDHIKRKLHRPGIDLVAPMQVGWYNAREPAETRLPEPVGPGSLALVLGNTRAMWDPFVASLRRKPRRLLTLAPLDSYVARAVGDAVAGVDPAPSAHLAHGPGSRSFSIQRAAAGSGLFDLAPCHLTIHPEVGLWFGLRAVLVFALPGPAQPIGQQPSPCHSCREKPCLPLLRRALKGRDMPTGSIRKAWKPWLAMRDACPVGRRHRYGPDQVRYHYTVRRRHLLRALVGV